MIVEFSVENFRSIKEMQTLSFQATGLKSPEEFSIVDKNNIETECGIRLLKTVGLYGANGSGKSNIVRALDYFLRAIKKEPSSESNLSSLCDPFLYQDDATETASFFQIILIISNRKYRYGFTVKKNKDYTGQANSSKEIVEKEWLYATKEINAVRSFLREGLSLTSESNTEQEKIPPIPYVHSLYLTHEAAFNSDSSSAIIRNYFKGWTLSNIVNEFETFRYNTIRFIEKENGKNKFLELLAAFNLQYDDIIIDRDDKSVQAILPHDKILLKKNFINHNNETVDINLNLAKTESSGTQRLFDIVGVLLREFSQEFGAFLIIDEVDSNFHPALLIKIISLFNDPTVNKSKMQLLFTSHDTNLMSPEIMRRDQFYFTEKKEDNSTRLYSLSDMKGVRNDADFARQYLKGYYGAIPLFDNYIQMQSNSQPDGTLAS